jgi:H+/Cl- antiporter ClcA
LGHTLAAVASSDAGATAPAPTDPRELLKTRSYLVMLVLGAVLGFPVATVAYFYLNWVNVAQDYVFTTLPDQLGFHGEPVWWPVLPLALSGVIVALSIQYMPGTSGHKPAEGFKAGGAVPPINLPGIIVASFATLALGAVLGPEAPLIAMGSGLGVLAIHLLKRDAPENAVMVIGAAGSFAAISTLLGSPVTSAFLLMEASGLGGPLIGIILVPGLLAAGIGALVFVGLDSWTGYGPVSLAIPHIPHVGSPTGAEFLWAIGIGVAAAAVGAGISKIGLVLQPIIERRKILLTPVAGLVVAGLAIAFAEATHHSSSEVLFSGQSALPTLLENPGVYTAGALVLLVLFKSLAYGVSLSSFRGGPVFPSLFIGGAGGILLAHLPGLNTFAGADMGIGAMAVAMLNLPLTAVLLAAILLPTDATNLLPLVIVAVVVAYVTSAHLRPTATT